LKHTKKPEKKSRGAKHCGQRHDNVIRNNIKKVVIEGGKVKDVSRAKRRGTEGEAHALAARYGRATEKKVMGGGVAIDVKSTTSSRLPTANRPVTFAKD